ncbi:MAG: circularly permuted type 2 ATP-grasp protein [Butyricicoccus sp.]|nr:circularly permuted type 2 ATP-grasp protein [Butyricicoccus sp.]
MGFDRLPKDDFAFLEKGLKQRVMALNLFIQDIYGEKQIIRDRVVPEEFVYASSGYLAQCEGVQPPKGVYTHIAGIDLVQGKDGSWYILEDNLRVPSGASYPMIARDLCRRSSPETFRQYQIEDNRNYAHLYFVDYSGRKEPVGAVYRRISDDYLDPMNFRDDSVIGIPHLYDIYRKGNVALLNAPGNGVADDKGIYYFVPKMIRYYLGEEPILQNAPTYLPFYPEDMSYVLDHFDELVLKDVAEAGGYGVVFGSKMTAAQKADFLDLLRREPRRFIAQEVIDFRDLDIMDEGKRVPRKADLRAFVLLGEEPMVWKSGLTRFSRNPDSFIVNSSQGGGFKDTWVLSR